MSHAPTVDSAGVRPTKSTPGVAIGARRTLRAQVASLERELVEQRCSSWPRAIAELGPPGRGSAGVGPRLLSVGELEVLRDELVATLSAERKAHADRTLAEEERRRLREELVLDPAAHPGARVSNAEMGEGGCGEVRSEPAGGLLGMLMGWWRVIVSSGALTGTGRVSSGQAGRPLGRPGGRPLGVPGGDGPFQFRYAPSERPTPPGAARRPRSYPRALARRCGNCSSASSRTVVARPPASSGTGPAPAAAEVPPRRGRAPR